MIAGQGTIGAEILRQSRGRLDAVFVPVGGGGLIAGIAGYLKALLPAVKVVGVEPFEADAMWRSLQAGERVRLEHVGIFADGVAVREVGETTFRIARAVRGRGRARHERRDLRRDQGRVRRHPQRDGAGRGAGGGRAQELGGPAAAATAASGWWRSCRGANMNFDRLRFVAERAEVGEAREALLGVTIPERPGAFREFCAAIGPRVVTEFNYRLAGRDAAHIFVGLRTASREDGLAVAAALRERGYATLDLTDDEMAKLHVRYMVGGRADGAERAALPLRVPRAAGGAHAVPRDARRPLQHQPLPLPEPRRRLRPRAGRLRGARRRARRVPELPRAARLSLRSPEADNPAYALFLAGNGS